jgi:ribulose-phosphate 3-epimerase
VNPPTPLADIERLLPHCDVIMLMGVMPGYAGQAYAEDTTSRLAEVRQAIDRAGLETLIEVDGGINEETARYAIGAGADVLVSASFVFKHPQGYAEALGQLRAPADET